MSEPFLWGSKIDLPSGIYDPHVTALKNGTFLVVARAGRVWSEAKMKAWIYNADGSLKAEQVLKIPDGDVPPHIDQIGGWNLGKGGFNPIIMELPDGRFSLTWTEHRESSDGIYVAPWTGIYNADLTPSSKPVLVLDPSFNSRYYTQSVASLGDGRTITAVSSLHDKAFVRVLNPDGTRSNVIEFDAVNASEYDPIADLTVLDNGNVAFMVRESSSTFRCYVLAPAGLGGLSPTGITFSIEAVVAPNNADVKLTALEGGRFVVTWIENGKVGTPPSEPEPITIVKFQVFNATGTKVGEPEAFYASAQEADAIGTPDVVAIPGGGFALAAQVVPNSSISKSEVRLAIFDGDGNRVSEKLLVDKPASEQLFSVTGLSLLADGRIAAHLSSGIQIVDPRDKAISLKGTADEDHYIGTAFNDTFEGSAGADKLEGGNGIDFVSFATAKAGVTASLSGGTEGDAAGDTYISIEGIIGSSFDDIFFGNGSATLKGGRGNDTYSIKAGDVFEEAADEGRDTVIVEASYALKADAQIEALKLSGVSAKTAANLTGSNIGNEIIGHGGTNTLRGLSGNDILKASSGNDTLKGDAGSDTLYGGSGNDKLYGGTGTGRDAFVFDTKPSKSTNVDRIYDFNPTYDSIQLENKIFTKLGKGSATGVKFKADMFVKGDAAKDKEDRIIYDGKTGALYYDQDGTGSKAQVKIATLNKNLKLTASDFFVI
jgi:Ca2+-binding RTX toxin-like protein